MADSITPLYWCLLILGVLQVTQAAELRCYNGSLDNYVTTPIETPLKILDNLDKLKKTVMFVFGLNGSEDDDSTHTIVSAFLAIGGYNVLLFDWSEEAKSYLLRLDYPVIILNARKVATAFGKALVTLINNGLSGFIHLVGHSLGAHIVGWAGEEVQKSNYNISRLTGLDPAGPLFGCPIGFDGLRPFQGKFVDVLHTNPGQLGTEESVGVVDFWPNCGDFLQPGCEGTVIVNAPSCNHAYAWRLFGLAIRSPNAYQGVRASSCADWKKNNPTTPVNYLGNRVITSLPGNFYFSTKPQ